MIRWLGKVEPNSVNTNILSSLDWFPTIGALAGYSLKPSVSYDGVDVTAALFTAAPSPRTTFFFHSVSNVLCDGAVVSSSNDDIEIRAARGEVFDAASHWPNRIGGDIAPPTTCNFMLNVGIATPTVGGKLHPHNNYYAPDSQLAISLHSWEISKPVWSCRQGCCQRCHEPAGVLPAVSGRQPMCCLSMALTGLPGRQRISVGLLPAHRPDTGRPLTRARHYCM